MEAPDALVRRLFHRVRVTRRARPEHVEAYLGRCLELVARAAAAMTARRSQTFIGARHRARLARRDAPVAITATARELACLIYTLVTRGEEYVERGIETYEQRRHNRTVSNLGRRAKQLGYKLVKAVENENLTNPAESMA